MILLISIGLLSGLFFSTTFILNWMMSLEGGQMVNTFLVALFSGVIATSLFLMARNKAGKPSELAAVDATQSSEVIF